MQAVVKTNQCRITGDYDHKAGDALSLFDAATTRQILSVCSAEMRAFGYSAGTTELMSREILFCTVGKSCQSRRQFSYFKRTYPRNQLNTPRQFHMAWTSTVTSRVALSLTLCAYDAF